MLNPSREAALFARVRQLCTVVDDFEATVEHLARDFDIGPFRCWHFRAPVLYRTTFRGRPAVWTMKLGITWLDDLQWEVIEPVDGASLYREHLQTHGRGVQHLLMDTGALRFEAAADRLAAFGHPFDQTAMINARVRVGRVTLPPIPNRLAPPVSLQFGYVDLERELGCAVELTRYPLGVSERFALRAGRAERCIPDGDSHFERPLPQLRVRRAAKATIVTANLDATVRQWIALAGVRPWHIFERARARVAWALLDDFLVELVEPRDGYHAAMLATRGQAVATIGVEPRGSFDELLEHCAGLGHRLHATEPLVAGRATIVDTRRTLGTDLELLDGNVAALVRATPADHVVA